MLTAARHSDLIRELMLRLESMPMASLRPYEVEIDGPVLTLDGFTSDEVMYHIRLLRQAGFIDGPAEQPIDGNLMFSGFTWAGCEFLANIRDNEVWSKTKTILSKVGSASLSVVAEVAKGVINKQLGIAP